jgi:hypothetical protein
MHLTTNSVVTTCTTKFIETSKEKLKLIPTLVTSVHLFHLNCVSDEDNKQKIKIIKTH